MINTGLTEQEKESLLKWFLARSGITAFEDGSYSVAFGNNEGTALIYKFEKPIADMIIKAMDNLRGIR